SLRDCLRFLPRTKGISQRVHVRIGADARIPEQVPRTADLRAPFKDHIAFAGAARLQTVASPDAGKPGADDDDVKVLSGYSQTCTPDYIERCYRERAGTAIKRLRTETESRKLKAESRKPKAEPYFAALAIFTPLELAAYRAIPRYSAS